MVIRVLSLFDGISGGRIVLDRLGVPCVYYASEIDVDAIYVAKRAYPDIIELGDVLDIDYDSLYPIDLLIAGSPCQNLSCAGDRKGLYGEKSKLFFEFLKAFRILRPKYFMLENVVMNKNNAEIISGYLDVEPLVLCASEISAIRRRRMYWTNIPFGGLKMERKTIGEVLQRKHFLNVTERYLKKRLGTLAYVKSRKQTISLYEVAYSVTTSCQDLCKSGNTNIKVGRNFYTFNVEGVEIMHEYTEGYTRGFSNTKRSSMLGNGWHLGVVKQILSGIKEMEKEDD